MQIKQEDDGKHGQFYIEVDGDRLAQMTYTWAGPNKFIIEHTEVDDALRGKSAGKQMVMKAVAFARDQGKKILPLCPFANSVFKKVPEIRDVL
ncbi:GNAT family N-acetyltransferase [Maribacter halichondriae]|uniref:GNAT family N-acetyltransferase n=1 Tax=Maribacter halichondriae TaxID=2980554 RepID=UPI00235970D9|nr:GNAT family N-acetyltransferase [Maribacter sp. Hal144]